MTLIKNIKTTDSDRKYFDEKAKINEAARQGKLGKSWLKQDPKTGEHKVAPKKIFKRV